MEDKYYIELKEKALKVEIYDKAKDYAKDKNKVNAYFEMGELLSKAGREYGKNIINNYSEKLMIEVGKKYNYRTLYRMRQFYELFSSGKLTTMWSKLSWSHYREILSLKDVDEIKYYLDECESKNLTQRQLHELIKQKTYNRLSIAAKNKLINRECLKVNDLIPNPIIIKTNSLKEELTEYTLKQLILDNLDDFLNQLGIGFTYVGNEYKIKLGDKYNYIDLLLYNIKFKCYVVIELKITELSSNHTGQIQKYMNYIDKNVKNLDDNKTVGIIICKRNNQYVIDYCSDNRVIAREYELV